jgi:hypothetical protein
MVEIDSELLDLKQYLTYSNEFINTFCMCRAGFENDVNEIIGYNSIYGYVIDNNKETIVKATNDYALGKITAGTVRASVRVFDNKDQICFKNQDIIDKLIIKNIRYTVYDNGYDRNSKEAVKWKK